MLYTLPFIAALIGWLTNYIAVKMLFHPRQEINLLFLKIQGVFPRRQREFADKLGQLVSNELFSAGDLRLLLMEKAASPRVFEILEQRLEELISDKLPDISPLFSSLLNPKITKSLKRTFSRRLNGFVEAVVEGLVSDLDQNLDVHAVVQEKVAAFSNVELEDMLLTVMRKEFRFIELVGAFLGFLIGCIQVLLIMGVNY